MAKNPLKWQPHEYYTYNLMHNKELTIKEMQNEYNRLRNLANSRLERLSKSEFKNVQAYTLNKGKFSLPASHYKSRAKLSMKLYEVSRFMQAKSSSVRGQRRIHKKTIESLKAAGYNFINKNNLKQFGDFMEDMRSRSGGHLVDSDRVAEVFGIARDLGVDSQSLERDFDLWLANKNKLKDMKRYKGKKIDSSRYLNKLYKEDKLTVPKKMKYSKSAKDVLDKFSSNVKEKNIKSLPHQTIRTAKDLDLDDYFQ